MFFAILTNSWYKYLTFSTSQLLAKKNFKEITTTFLRKKDAFLLLAEKSVVLILTNFVIFSYKLKQEG
jgi:hypothetical protein